MLSTITDSPLPLRIGCASLRAYDALSHYHYHPNRPATCAGVWAIYPNEPTAHPRPIAVAILSWPTLRCCARESALHLDALSPQSRTRWLNRHLRTISRIIVHPQFRSLGLATTLIRHILRESSTTYIEAIVKRGPSHPFFLRADMTQHPSPHSAYYLWHNPAFTNPDLTDTASAAHTAALPDAPLLSLTHDP